MLTLLGGLLGSLSGVDYGELRFHDRIHNAIAVRQGDLETASSVRYGGVGVRVLVRSGWGFSSTSRVDSAGIEQAIADAVRAAEAASRGSCGSDVKLGEAHLATGTYQVDVDDPLADHPFEEKLVLVRDTERRVRGASPHIQSAMVQYTEYIDEKAIVTTDGGRVRIIDSKPEFWVVAIGSDNGECTYASEMEAVTGGWGDLFRNRTPEEMADQAVDRACRLLKASYPPGERATVILDPALVGILAHEAIGHTVEADFVLSGAITKGKLGERVASEQVTLVDSGPIQYDGKPSGVVLVDDEGVVSEKTVVIENGILKSYLHNRETAGLFGVASTGNARAFEYCDEPLIRMRNTYIEPGDRSLEEIISEVEDGYLLQQMGMGGQADANAEFMFAAGEAYRIRKGRKEELLRGVTVSGQAFEVLQSVDAMTREFKWGGGTGYCGKGQLAKVDAGGPYIRCTAIIGGRHQ
jgi:TldD protein